MVGIRKAILGVSGIFLLLLLTVIILLAAKHTNRKKIASIPETGQTGKNGIRLEANGFAYAWVNEPYGLSVILTGGEPYRDGKGKYRVCVEASLPEGLRVEGVTTKRTEELRPVTSCAKTKFDSWPRADQVRVTGAADRPQKGYLTLYVLDRADRGQIGTYIISVLGKAAKLRTALGVTNKVTFLDNLEEFVIYGYPVEDWQNSIRLNTSAAEVQLGIDLPAHKACLFYPSPVEFSLEKKKGAYRGWSAFLYFKFRPDISETSEMGEGFVVGFVPTGFSCEPNAPLGWPGGVGVKVDVRPGVGEPDTNFVTAVFGQKAVGEAAANPLQKNWLEDGRTHSMRVVLAPKCSTKILDLKGEERTVDGFWLNVWIDCKDRLCEDIGKAPKEEPDVSQCVPASFLQGKMKLAITGGSGLKSVQRITLNDLRSIFIK